MFQTLSSSFALALRNPGTLVVANVYQMYHCTYLFNIFHRLNKTVEVGVWLKSHCIFSKLFSWLKDEEEGNFVCYGCLHLRPVLRFGNYSIPVCERESENGKSNICYAELDCAKSVEFFRSVENGTCCPSTWCRRLE